MRQEHQRRQEELVEMHRLANEAAEQARQEHLERTARLVNLVLPLGWLPLGVMTAAEGNRRAGIVGLPGDDARSARPVSGGPTVRPIATVSRRLYGSQGGDGPP